MSIESDTDRLNMLKAMGEQANVTHTVSAEDWEIYVIMDQEFLESLDVDTSHPVALCRERDIYRASITTRDGAGRAGTGDRANTIQVSRGSFNIINWRPDGTGMALLILASP